MKALVVGVSAVATENYLPYLCARPGIELVVYNRTAAVADIAATRFGAEIARDLTTAAGQADVAFVLTTEAPRHDIVRSLISAGTPRIFCEKPFVARDGMHVDAEDFRAGAELLADARDAGIEIAQQFNYRYMATVTTALEAAVEHDLGAVCTFTVQSHFGTWAHVIDLVSLISGGIAEVTALAGPRRIGNGMESEDLAAAMRSHSGVVGALLGSVATSWETPLFRFDVSYERGAVRFADFSEPVQLTVGDETRMVPLSPELPRWDQYRASFTASLDAYLAAIASDTAPPVRGEDGVEELRLEAAIRLSAAEGGRRVVLDEDLPFVRPMAARR